MAFISTIQKYICHFSDVRETIYILARAFDKVWYIELPCLTDRIFVARIDRFDGLSCFLSPLTTPWKNDFFFFNLVSSNYILPKKKARVFLLKIITVNFYRHAIISKPLIGPLHRPWNLNRWILHSLSIQCQWRLFVVNRLVVSRH